MAISNDDQAFAPFALTLEPTVFFTGSGRGAVLEELFESVDSGAPVCLVTGANGAGKSALVAQLASRFEHMADVLYLPQPRLRPSRSGSTAGRRRTVTSPNGS